MRSNQLIVSGRAITETTHPGTDWPVSVMWSDGKHFASVEGETVEDCRETLERMTHGALQQIWRNGAYEAP